MVRRVGDAFENPEAEIEAGFDQGIAISADQVIRNLRGFRGEPATR